MEAIKLLLSNEYFIGGIMALIIVGLTQLIKFPIKAATKHIKNEVVRKCVNSVILLIPFAFGLFGEFLYVYFVLHVPFVGEIGGISGGFSLLLYGAISRMQEIIKSKKDEADNPYESEEGKAIQELVNKVMEDGKIDKSDLGAIEEFWAKIGNGNKKK